MKTKHNILVADTDISNLEFLKNNLSGENYEVTTAVDDTAILQMIEEKKIDLVLLSDQIAKGGTMDLIKNIKASANDRMIPTILMVSKDDPQTRQESAAMGCDDILIKPLIPEEVAIRIDTHLQINYYRPFLNEKEKFEFILDNIDDGIIVFDKELNILHFNKRAKDLFDLDLDALPENFLGHISHMYRVHYDSDLSSDLYKNPIVFDLERPATPELKALFLETKFSTVKNPMGETASIIMYLRDVTEKRCQDLLQSNFLSLISHKLRTPVTIINGTADLMKDGLLGKLSEEQAESLESIRNSSLQLNSLIEKLLTFTVVTAKGPGISKEPVNINTHVSSMAEPYVKSLAGNKKNTVRITCSDEKLTTKISPSSLDTMLKNILENSVKFNDKDAIDIEINIEQDGDRSRIIVSDNGRGIAPEERVKIFDKFYQIEKFFTGNIDGAGLGLALIKHLINAYGGQIKMDSELGKGTRLSFSLPE